MQESNFWEILILSKLFMVALLVFYFYFSWLEIMLDPLPDAFESTTTYPFVPKFFCSFYVCNFVYLNRKVSKIHRESQSSWAWHALKKKKKIIFEIFCCPGWQ